VKREDVPFMEYVEEGLVYKDICAICFCQVREGAMRAHLDWHRIAATPELHKVVVDKALRGVE